METAREAVGAIKDRIGTWLGGGRAATETEPPRPESRPSLEREATPPRTAPPDRDALLGRGSPSVSRTTEAPDRTALLGKRPREAREEGRVDREAVLGRSEVKAEPERAPLPSRDGCDRGR